MKGNSTRWEGHADHAQQKTDAKSLYKRNSDRTGRKIRMSDHTENVSQRMVRGVWRTDADNASLHSGFQSLLTNDDENQTYTQSQYYKHVTVRDSLSKRTVADSTSRSNEENSSLLNIKITSAFSLSSNIPYSLNGKGPTNLEPDVESQISSYFANFPTLWQTCENMKTVTAKCYHSHETDHREEPIGSQISPFHSIKDFDQRQLRDTHSKRRLEIAAEDKTAICPRHWCMRQEKSGTPHLPFRDRDPHRKEIKPTKRDFETENGQLQLHEHASIKFPELESVLHGKDEHLDSNPQTLTDRTDNSARPGSTERYQQANAAPKSLASTVRKRKKRDQLSDESFTCTSHMIARENERSVSRTSSDHHLPCMSRDRITGLVDYSGKVPLPWKRQKLSPERFCKFQMINKTQQQSNNDSKYGRQHETTPPPLETMDQVEKQIDLMSAHPKRNPPNSHLLITPAPILFENLNNMLCLESDEEPIVKVPNYFLDLAIASTQAKPNSFTKHLQNDSVKEKASSQASDETSQPGFTINHKTQSESEDKTIRIDEIRKIESSLPNMKLPESATNLLLVHKPSQKRASQYSGFYLGENEGTKPTAHSQAFPRVSRAPPVNEFPSQASDETKPEAGQFSKPYKRTGGAHPSIKPTPDFNMLLPSTTEKILCGRHTDEESMAPSDMDKRLQETKSRPNCLSDKFSIVEGKHGVSSTEDEFSLHVQDTRIPNDITNLLEFDNSNFTKDLEAETLLYHPRENRYLNECPDKQITSTYIETTNGEELILELYEERKYQCELCGRIFSRNDTLIKHQRIHSDESDLSGSALSRHELPHATLKPHECPQCSKSFTRTESNLKTHLRTHTNYKSFVCEFCGKGFHQKVDMKIHQYTHTGEKPHKCCKCGRRFKQLTHLKYHMRTHSEERLFSCQYCGKGFNQKGNLQAHEYGHTGNRPHRCDICGKAFTLTSILNTHKRIHAVDKPFKCQFCDKAFYQKNALKTHYISSHPYTDGVCLL